MKTNLIIRKGICEHYTIEHEDHSLRSVIATVHDATICPEHGNTKDYLYAMAAAPAMKEAIEGAINMIETGDNSLALYVLKQALAKATP